MRSKKPKVGRPKLPKDQIKNVIAIRLTEYERSAYEERAAMEGLRLSDWIRQSLKHA